MGIPASRIDNEAQCAQPCDEFILIFRLRVNVGRLLFVAQARFSCCWAVGGFAVLLGAYQLWQWTQEVLQSMILCARGVAEVETPGVCTLHDRLFLMGCAFLLFFCGVCILPILRARGRASCSSSVVSFLAWRRCAFYGTAQHLLS